MRFKRAPELLRLLPRNEADAITAAQLCDRWSDGAISQKTARRLLQEAVLKPKAASGQALARTADLCGPRGAVRYYLNPLGLATLTASTDGEEAARTYVASQMTLGSKRNSADSRRFVGIEGLLSQVRSDPEVQQRLVDRIRFPHDWIGRQPARVDDAVLRACLEALGTAQPLAIVFRDRHEDTAIRKRTVHPHALIVKDATIYLVAADRSRRLQIHALHRVSEARATTGEFIAIQDFDVDDYIEKTHGFSFLIDDIAAPIDLVIQVAPETMYHFLERALPGQTLGDLDPVTGWRQVRARVPMSVLLVPFLLSMGHWIKVTAPDAVVREMAWRAHGIAAHYPKTLAAGGSPFDAGCAPETPGHEA